MRALVSFLGAVAAYWMALVPGGLLSLVEIARRSSPAFEAWLSEVISPQVVHRFWRWAMVGGLIIACYLAYNRLNEELETVKQEIGRLKALPGSPEALQKKVSDLQAEISQLRATRWPPLNSVQTDALKRRLASLRPRPIQVTYSGSESYLLAKSFDDIFAELKWPRAFPADVALSGGEGIRFYPHTEQDIEVLNVIAEATGLVITQAPTRAPDGGNDSLLYVGFPK